jgi:uncharacterized protein
MESAASLTIDLGDGSTVSALLRLPPRASAVYALAHGAGAGMDHPFLVAVADGLAARGVATLRYQFPFMERGSKRPDPPRLAHATVRAAVAAAAQAAPDLALFAGGKSFGGRMSSQAQATAAMPGVVGLAFLGFPLHPAKQPASERGEHLAAVSCPMLFLQGTRDELADLALMTALCERLGPRATLALVDDADHSFHVRARSGRNDAQALAAMLDTMAGWMARIAAA